MVYILISVHDGVRKRGREREREREPKICWVQKRCMQPNIPLTRRDGGSEFDSGHEQVELKVRIGSSVYTSHDFVFSKRMELSVIHSHTHVQTYVHI